MLVHEQGEQFGIAELSTETKKQIQSDSLIVGKRDNINTVMAFNNSDRLPTDYMSKTGGNMDIFDDNYLQ
jgi:hypothetical protein